MIHSKPRENDLYATEGYGINVPTLRNDMKRDTYKVLRRYIHFCDNSEKKKPGENGYDQLHKVFYVLDAVGKGIR